MAPAERVYPPTPRLAEPSLDVESWSESLDYVAYESVGSLEVEDKKGFMGIAQRYIDGGVSLHLHLRVRPGGLDSDPCEFCAVIASDHRGVSDPQDLAYVVDGERVPGEQTRIWAFLAVGDLDRRGAREGAPGVDEPMLVHVVKPRKQGQIRLRRVFSVLKGLDRLDECPIIRAYAAKHPYARLIPLPAFVDGELRLPAGGAASKEHDLPNEIVKRGAQVVSELPDDEPDTGIGRLAAETEDVLAGIALELTDDAAIFLVKEGVPFSVERGQVLVRSLKPPVDGL